MRLFKLAAGAFGISQAAQLNASDALSRVERSSTWRGSRPNAELNDISRNGRIIDGVVAPKYVEDEASCECVCKDQVPQKNCNQNIHVQVDTSACIDAEILVQIKKTVKEYLKELKAYYPSAKVALSVFDTKYEWITNAHGGSHAVSIHNAIQQVDNMRFMGSGVDLDLAMTEARTYFNEENVDGEGNKNILILVTDGKYTTGDLSGLSIKAQKMASDFEVWPLTIHHCTAEQETADYKCPNSEIIKRFIGPNIERGMDEGRVGKFRVMSPDASQNDQIISQMTTVQCRYPEVDQCHKVGCDCECDVKIPDPEPRAGIVGEVGPKGERGEPGTNGNPGPNGNPGDDGARGPPGDDGARGPKGISGQPGSPGLKGAPGNPGRDGPPGSKGARGAPGPNAPYQRSSVGPPGPRGEDGPPGSNGIPGRDGDDGADGLPGPPGAKGYQGSPGRNGPPGPDGPDGESCVGTDGNPGPPGPPGKDGLDGLDGIDGLNGANGEHGEVGEPGEPGADGEMGCVGDAGPDGPKGRKGLTGDDGPQGPRGLRGAPGLPGADGTPGSKGAIGAPGVNGVPGKKGMRGETGVPGTPGSNGEPGDNVCKGSAGRRGFKGPRGDCGAAGRDGEQGAQGPPGIRGYRGPPGPPGQYRPMSDETLEKIVTSFLVQYT